MTDVVGFEVPIDMPSFNLGLGTTSWLLIGFIILIIILGGVAIIIMQRFRIYKYKIILFENITGQGFQPTFRDRAKLVKLGDAGEELLYLLKKKVYRSAYGRKMGKNTYWFTVGQDGYWYNSILGDFDAKMGMLDIEPIDRDMRYMHVAIRKNIQDRYKKQGIMEKYGTMIISGIVLIVIVIAMYLIISKIVEVNNASVQSIEAAERTQQATQKIIASLDNLVSRLGSVEPRIQGSGLEEAPT